MSKGKTTTKSSGSTSTRQTLNPWSQQQWQKQYDTIQGKMKDTPFEAYTGPMVAGLSDRETQARDMYDTNMGSFNPAFDEASGMIRNSGRQADFGSVADQYMNPYQSQVIDVMKADANRRNDELNAQSTEAALRDKAFGGSGTAVQTALNNEATGRMLSEQEAQLLYQGYNDARGYYQQDIGTDERQAGQLTDLATRRHDMNMGDIMGLNGMGEVDRGIAQDTMGADYNEFLREQEDYYRRLGIDMSMLGSIPMLTNTNGTQSSTSTQTSNPGMLGTLGTLGGVASMFVPGMQGVGLGLMSGAMKTMSNPKTSGMHSGAGNGGF